MMHYKILGLWVLASFFLLSCTDALVKNSQSNEANLPSSIPNQSNECKILAIWDSLTAGYNLPPEESYSAQLEGILTRAGYPCRVINAGISGDTSKNLLDRLDFTLWNDSYSLVILVIGWNDGLRSLPVPEMKKNISDIVTRVQSKNFPILLAWMQMPANAWMQAAEFRKVYPEISKEFNIPLLPFFLEGVAMIPSLNIADGIHPNKEGYAIIANNVFQFLEKEKLLRKDFFIPN
jgi:acyl-CoA thioesterase I